MNKKDKRYFIAYPNLLPIVFILALAISIVITSKSIITALILTVLASIFIGFSSIIKGYKNRIELKYLGLLYFRNQSIYFNDIDQVHLTYNVGRYKLFVFEFFTKTGKKIKINLQDNGYDDPIILLHLIKQQDFKLTIDKDYKPVKQLNNQIDRERNFRSFNLDLRQYEEPKFHLEIVIGIIMLVIFTYILSMNG